jgi:hypothetical protein
MRRLVLVAALVSALVVVPALAQRGGIHGGFAGHGGFSGHGSFGGRVRGGASFGGMRERSGFHNPGFRRRDLGSSGVRFARRRFSQDHFLHNRRFQASRFHRFHHDRDDFRFRFGFRNCFGFNCAWGWGWPWWWDSDSSYDQDQERDFALANEMNRQSLEGQRERRQEDQDSDARSGPQPRSREDAGADPPAPSTVLVFRDQHRQEIQNYAITGTTLTAFAPQRTQRISLADLDIAATTKANDDRGVDFRVPGGEGQ